MKIINYILNIVFPSRCVFCSKILKMGQNICPDCLKKNVYAGKLCTKCGCVQNKCCCKYNRFLFEECVAPYAFDKNIKTLVYNLKFEGSAQTADFLADNMNKSINDYFYGIKFDAVTSVPMGKWSRYMRGYNQSRLLAKRIADKNNLPYAEVLFKRGNHIQHKLNRSERFKNVHGVFGIKRQYKCENILLIGDIKSTGATLNECARQLKFAGCKNVFCCVAATNCK